MPDLSHRPYEPMTIIRPHSKPAFWWLVPWAYACELHRAANAIRALSDKQHDTIREQAAVLADQEKEIEWLRTRIVDLEDTVVRGSASIPDARPIPEDCES